MKNKISEAQKRAVAKYRAANIHRYSLDINTKTEIDIYNKLCSAPNVAGYIKALIRADIDSNM